MQENKILIKAALITAMAFIIAIVGQLSLGMNYADPLFAAKYLPVEIIMFFTSIILWYLFLRKEVPIRFTHEINPTLLISLPLLMLPITVLIVALATAQEIDYSLLSTFFVTTIGVGVSEEIFFRGIAFGSLITLKVSPKNAILLSALLFSSFHLTNLASEVSTTLMIIQLVNTFMMGVIFAYIYYKTRNIFYLILIHIMWDFSLFSNTLLRGESIVGALMIALVLGYFIWAMINIFKLKKEN